MSAANGTALRKPASREGTAEARPITRSLAELVRLIDERPTEDLNLSPTELMMLIGSTDGFDGNARSQHESLMDRSEPEDVRVVACIWSHTIRNGPGTRGRFPFARRPDGLPLTRSDLKAELGIELSNLTSAIDLAIAKRRIREDEKGRFWLCGQVPKPSKRAPKDGEEKENKPEGEEKAIISGDKFPKYLLLRLQQVSKKTRENFLQGYSRAEQLQKELRADADALISLQMEPLYQKLYAALDLEPQPRRNARDFQKKPAKLKVEFAFQDLSPEITTPDLSPEISGRSSPEITATLLNTESSNSTEKLASCPQNSPENSPQTESPADQVRARVARSELQILDKRGEPIPLDGHSVGVAVQVLISVRPELRQAALDYFEAECWKYAARDPRNFEGWGIMVHAMRTAVKAAGEGRPPQRAEKRRASSFRDEFEETPDDVQPLSRAEQIVEDCRWVREFPNNVSTPRTRERLAAMRDDQDLPEELRILIRETLDETLRPALGVKKAGQA